MKHIGGGIYLKDRITLADVATYTRLREELEKTLGKATYYKNRIIKLFTNRKWFITFFDRLFLPKIIDAAAKGEKVEVPKDKTPYQHIIELGGWLSAYLGGTPWQNLENICQDEVESVVKSVSRKRLEDMLMIVKAHHLPEQTIQEIKDGLRELSESPGKISEPPKKPTTHYQAITNFLSAKLPRSKLPKSESIH